MVWLWLGLIIWSLVHFVPSVAPAVKTTLVDRLGKNGFKGIFAIGIVGAVVFMILGWRSVEVDIIYEPPAFGRHLAMLLMLIAFLLFAFSHGKSNLKRMIRHPQLASVVVWSIAHLLANGENRSVLLFGILGIWAVIEMLLINRRDAAPTLPEPRPWRAELKPVAIGIVIYVVFILAHPYLFGVSPIGA